MKKDVFRKGIVIAIFILFITVTACHPIGEIPPPQHEQLVHNVYLPIGRALSNKPGLDDSFELLFNRSINLLMRVGQIYSLSICLIKNNTIAWSNGYGLYDMEKNQKPNIDTCYLIASISKTITATAILQLYEQGLFGLDDNVNHELDFNIYNPNHPEVNITYRMLLNHTASLDTESTDFYDVYYNQDPPELSSWLNDYFYPNGEYNNNRWTDDTPGTEFKYSNLGFAVLGYLVELWSGQSLNEYCKENIFNPLDMDSTSFMLSELDSDNVAISYVLSYHSKKSQPDLYIPIPPYTVKFYPAGSLYTSPQDLSHFLIAHMNHGVYNGSRILENDTIDEMHNVSFSFNKMLDFGLGWGIWKNWLNKPTFMGHTGSLYGYKSIMKGKINDNSGIIYFVTKDASGGKYREKIQGLPYPFIELLLRIKLMKLG